MWPNEACYQRAHPTLVPTNWESESGCNQTNEVFLVTQSNSKRFDFVFSDRLRREDIVRNPSGKQHTHDTSICWTTLDVIALRAGEPVVPCILHRIQFQSQIVGMQLDVSAKPTSGFDCGHNLGFSAPCLAIDIGEVRIELKRFGEKMYHA